jgi:arginine decarboxylase
MRKLDVKEIHGYNASLGLKLLNPAALQSTKAQSGSGARAVKNAKHKSAAG